MDDELKNLEKGLDRGALKRALEGTKPPLLLIPRAVDAVVTSSAQNRAGQIQRRLWQRPLLAAAASILLAGGIFLAVKPAPAVFAAEDINKDGAVDIIDALALAKLQKEASSAHDLNNDGSVDSKDAEWLANRVVKLASHK